MFSHGHAGQSASSEQRQPGISHDGVGSFRGQRLLLSFATDVEESEEEMMFGVEIGRQTDFDLVVEFGGDIVVKDGGGDGRNEGTVARGGNVVESRAGAT